MVHGVPGFALVIHGGCAPVIARLPRVWKTRPTAAPALGRLAAAPVAADAPYTDFVPPPRGIPNHTPAEELDEATGSGRRPGQDGRTRLGRTQGSSGPHPSRRARPITSRTGSADSQTRKQPTDQGDTCGRQITTKHLLQHRLPCPRTDDSPACMLDKRLIGAGSPQPIEILKPVTNQVTTSVRRVLSSGSGKFSAVVVAGVLIWGSCYGWRWCAPTAAGGRLPGPD